jgi:hypothetical protein
VKVEEALVGPVGRFACPKGRREQVEELAVEVKGRGVDIIDGTDAVVTVLKDGGDFERAAATVGELGDGVGFSGALNLDRTDDDVADLESAKGAAAVGAMGGVETAVFGKVPEDFDGECGLTLAEPEEFVKVGDLEVVWGKVGDGGEVAVDWEAEWSSYGRNAADNIGTVDRRSVPCVVGAVDGFAGDFEVVVALVDGDGDGLIEEAEEPFDDDGFVVPTESRFAGELEGGAHLLEVAKESGAGVGGDKKAESDTEEDVFHEGFSERGGIGGC